MSLSFTCPRCRAHLKVRDESFLGTNLDCPECRAPLQVAKSDTGEIVGRELLPQHPEPSNRAQKSKPGGHPNPSKPGSRSALASTSDPLPFEPPLALSSGSRTPQIVAWTVTGICLLGLIPFLLPTSQPANPVPDVPPVVQPGENPPAAQPAVVKADLPAEQAPPQPLPDTPEGRLRELGKLVLEQSRLDGRFPAGAVPAAGLEPAQRWSWLAQIAGRHDNPHATHIGWNQRWNDPSQDPFVRRVVPRFQNPLVPLKASEDKYPATHFVGVAGVGADAPTLSADHPRAGIFGQDRQTKLDQIRDGASNTMLLAGVEEHLGSWAAGSSSHRSFSHEPYIRGPDGFGTGQPDSMLVLMADGSVRTLNKQTDPRLVRRMAAMSDGFPLDSDVSGEPGDPRPGSVPIPDPLTAKVKPPDKPVTPANTTPPVEPPVEKVIDIPAALSRKILKFDQTKPAEAFRLLLQIEELAGVRIEYDRARLGPLAARLDKPITLIKQNVSLEELLDDILKQIDLQRLNDKSCIRIVGPEST